MDDTIVSMEGYGDILSLINNLPSSMKEITILFLVHDLSYSEISDITGLSYETVKKRAYRAKLLIKDKLIKSRERR